MVEAVAVYATFIKVLIDSHLSALLMQIPFFKLYRSMCPFWPQPSATIVHISVPFMGTHTQTHTHTH